jgi:hypothetical protein
MTGGRCTRTPGVACVRMPGHQGCCTVAPSAATLDWDRNRETIAERHIAAAVDLLALDFPTPDFADLLDDEEDAA